MLKASAGVELREVPASKHFKRLELDSLWGFSSGNKVWIHAHDNKWFDNLHQPLGGARHSFQRMMWGSDIASSRKANLTTFTVFPYFPLCILSKASIYLIFPSPLPTFHYDQWIMGSSGSPPLVPDDLIHLPKGFNSCWKGPTLDPQHIPCPLASPHFPEKCRKLGWSSLCARETLEKWFSKWPIFVQRLCCSV